MVELENRHLCRPRISARLLDWVSGEATPTLALQVEYGAGQVWRDSPIGLAARPAAKLPTVNAGLEWWGNDHADCGNLSLTIPPQPNWLVVCVAHGLRRRRVHCVALVLPLQPLQMLTVQIKHLLELF